MHNIKIRSRVSNQLHIFLSCVIFEFTSNKVSLILNVLQQFNKQNKY